MFSGNRKKIQQSFLLRHHHLSTHLESSWELRFAGEHSKKCRLAVQAGVFLTRKPRRKLEWRAPSSCLEKELQLKLSKVAGTMNIVTKCVHFWSGMECWLLVVSKKYVQDCFDTCIYNKKCCGGGGWISVTSCSCVFHVTDVVNICLQSLLDRPFVLNEIKKELGVWICDLEIKVSLKL